MSSELQLAKGWKSLIAVSGRELTYYKKKRKEHLKTNRKRTKNSKMKISVEENERKRNVVIWKIFKRSFHYFLQGEMESLDMTLLFCKPLLRNKSLLLFWYRERVTVFPFDYSTSSFLNAFRALEALWSRMLWNGPLKFSDDCSYNASQEGTKPGYKYGPFSSLLANSYASLMSPLPFLIFLVFFPWQ